MKLCTKCGKPKDGAMRSWCKACANAYYREKRRMGVERYTYAGYQKGWDQRNREKRAAYKRRATLKRQYGMTEAQYAEMALRQGFVCAICGQEPNSKGLVVDHDHTSGQVRALLCSNCNCALGLLDDDPCRVEALLKYVMEYRQEETADSDELGGQ